MRHRVGPRAGLAALAMAAAAAGLSGCGSATAPAAAQAKEEPATVSSVPGSAVPRITLTDQAEHRLGIATSPVRAGAGGLILPYAAVVYDADGKAFAFARVAPHTYTRVQLVIRSIDGDTVHLRTGPRAGTEVVTVGAAELVGTEAGISGEE